MAGLFDALNSASTSLQVSQKQIEVTGSNIANVDTVGYSRQDAEISPHPSLNYGGFFIGQGVTITSVERAYNSFVSDQLVEKSSDFGYENGKTDIYSELERIFPITNNNLSTDINTFFDSWQQLSTKPTDLVLRDAVIQQGDVLSQRFNAVAEELDNVQTNIGDKITANIDELNSKLNQVAELNQRIYLIETNGQSANSARDQRDVLVKDLSQALGAQSYELESGMINVQLPAGLPLVNGTANSTFEAVSQGSSLELHLKAAGTTRQVTAKNMAGEMGALFEMREEYIPSLEKELDHLAYSLITGVNALHQAGAGIDGSTGVNFFKDPPNLNNPVIDPAIGDTEGNWEYAARNMSIGNTDAAKVAAAKAPEAGQDVLLGDNTNALAIADLSYQPVVSGVDSFDSFYGKMTSNIGIASNQNKLNLGGAKDSLVQVENLRASYAGVSLDEEMINLIGFQRSYQTAAKYLSVVDELMGSLINIK
ncbi:MAG: flagellar hook-associated protein FlgK [Desulfotalea sp.]